MKKVKRNERYSLRPLQSNEKKLPARDVETNQSRSFVLRLWIENTSQDKQVVNWRGHITEVISRTGRHVKSIDEINAYLIHQLQEMGGKNIPI